MDKDFNKAIRSDIGDLIIHWTRGDIDTGLSAFEILKKILNEGFLKGASGFIKGGHNCVCFTESPLADITRVFTLVKAYNEKGHRYEPFGIGTRKQWLFEKGGRPVIYSDYSEYNLLNDNIKWRHVSYNPPETDFTWEREWRIKTDKLELNTSKMFIIVPSKKYYDEILSLTKNKWMVFALSPLGLPLE